MSRPARSLIANGPIGNPKSNSTRSTCAGVAPSRIIFSASAPRVNSMRLPTKPGHTPTITGDLADLLADRHRRGDDRVGRLLAAHVLEQLHHVGRGEEVHADHALGPRRDRGDLVDVERRGVRWRGSRRACRSRRAHAKIDFFSSMSSNTASMTMSHVGEVGLVGRAGDQRHPLLDRLRRDATRVRPTFVVLADHAEAAVERLLVAFDDRHRDADVGEVHRDAAAHRAGAEDAARLDVDDRGVLGDVGDLVGRPLGEEGVALGRRLRAGHQLDEEFPLDLEAFVERQVRGGLDALDVVLRGEEAPGLLGDRGAELGEQLRVARRLGHLVVTVADSLQREALGDGPRWRRRPQRLAGRPARAVDHVVDQPDSSASVVLMWRPTSSSPAPSGRRRGGGAAGCRRRRAAGRGSPRAGRTSPTTPPPGSGRRAPPRGRRRVRCRGSQRSPGSANPPWRPAPPGADRLLRAATELGDVGAGDERAAVTDHDDAWRRRPSLRRARRRGPGGRGSSARSPAGCRR